MTATDIRYGKRGGNWLPPEPNEHLGPALRASLARVSCGCDIMWIVALVDVDKTCHSCGQPMRAVTVTGVVL